MRIQPVASPNLIPVNGTSEAQRTARAVEAFKAASPPPVAQETAVRDPNNISVEELSALNVQKEEEPLNNSTEVEGVKEEPKAPEQDPALSRQFAQLARQEKAVRAQVQAMKAKEQALAAREAALTQQPKVEQQDLSNYISKDRFKQDPLAVLAETGLSYDELTQQLINQQPANPRIEAHIGRLEAKIAELEQANKKSSESQAEQQANQYKAAVKQITQDVTKLVSNDPNFETIKATNSVQDVVDLITETYNKDGVILSIEDAAQQVEDYYVEEAMKLSQIDKIKKRLAANAQAASPVKQAQPQDPKQPQPMKTLTNDIASSRKLTQRERAIAAAEGRLK